MIEPSVLVDRIVELLRSVEDLAVSVDGPENIRPHYDSYPDALTLSDAIYQLRPPGMLVVWDGTGPAAFGTRELWSHRFRLVIRAKAETAMGWAPAGYYRLWKWIADGSPQSGDGQNMRRTEVHPGVYPIGSMQIGRALLMIDPATATAIEYFEVTFTLTERGDY